MTETSAVHVRTLALATLTEADLEACRAVLSDDERERAGRFVFPANRVEYIAAHGLVRQTLGALVGRAPADLVFAVPEEGGKPFLADPSGHGIDFNLSHTTGMVACAVGIGCAVGIDLEPLDRRIELGIARRFFAADEYQWLTDLDDGARAAGFLRLWTLKEAVAKAVGLGLQLGFDAFSVRPDPPRLEVPPPGFATAWRLQQWQPGPGHLAALACHGPAPVVDVEPGRISLR